MAVFNNLFSNEQPTSMFGEQERTWGDRFNNPMTQFGLTLLQNHGRPTRQAGPLSGLSENLDRAQQYQMHDQEKREAAQLAAQQGAASAEQNEQFMAYLAQEHPDLVGLARSQMGVVERLVEDRKKRAGEAPSLETIYDPETGQPYKAQWNYQVSDWDQVGGTKAPTGPLGPNPTNKIYPVTTGGRINGRWTRPFRRALPRNDHRASATAVKLLPKSFPRNSSTRSDM